MVCLYIGTKDPHLSDECGSGEKSKLLNLMSVCCKLASSPGHMAIMQRNNQTRYMACSVAAVYLEMASIIRDTSGDTTRTTLQPPPVPPSLCL